LYNFDFMRLPCPAASTMAILFKASDLLLYLYSIEEYISLWRKRKESPYDWLSFFATPIIKS